MRICGKPTWQQYVDDDDDNDDAHGSDWPPCSLSGRNSGCVCVLGGGHAWNDWIEFIHIYYTRM